MMTELQKRKAVHAFTLWDSNDDGWVDVSDYARVADRLCASRNWAKGSDDYDRIHQVYAGGWQLMQQFADVDHNHEVTQDEFVNCFDHIYQDPDLFHQVMVGTADLNFGAADLDGDGQWTLDEYRIYLQTLAAPEDHAEEVFRQADANGDGHLSKEEFTLLLNQFFLSDDPHAVGNLLLGSY